MRFLTARRLALAALVPALLAFCVVPGCSNQGEGERCDGDEDCSAGLVCANISTLLNKEAPRCCNPNHVTDSRCTPSTAAPSGAAAGSGGGAGTGGTADSGGAAPSAGSAGLTAAAGDAGAGGG